MTPEFSIPVSISELSPGGTTVKKKADETVRAALAARLNLSAVEKFEINMRLTPVSKGGGVIAEGYLAATIVQPCSVTLEPLVTKIHRTVSVRFDDVDDTALEEGEDIDVDAQDPPEPIVDGGFDIGETCVQLMAVEIDPFPRKPDLPFEDYARSPKGAEEPTESPSENPFAALAELKDKLEER